VNQSQLLARLKTEAAIIDQAMRCDLTTVVNPRLLEVLDYALFNGGKRVRPLLTILAARLCWQKQGQAVTPVQAADLVKLALTFEYLHAASLLHDDVIDRSECRRGRQTANRVWGNTPVVLAGDFLHARAMLLAGTLGGVECLTAIGAATTAMVESEFLQLDNAERRATSADRYFAVLEGKTAALIRAAIVSGALLAGAGAVEQQALRLFGGNLGLTFQIVDDLLDYQGDPQKTGKSVGNDFQEGKMTLPLILALEQANADDRAWLAAMLAGSGEERQRCFAEARRILEQSGALAAARRQAEALGGEAIAALACFAQGEEQETMAALVRYVLAREG